MSKRRVAAIIDHQLRAFAVRDARAPDRCTTSTLRAISPFHAKTDTPDFAIAAAA